jgi:outer membrane protein assembly factor BamB
VQVALTLLALALPAAAPTDNWPQFRGPHGDGHADATGLPVKWSESENIAWKTAIHDRGWSSPVIWNDQVWMTTARVDGKELFAVCVDRDTGKIVHDVKVFDVDKPAFCHPYNSYASPTPAVEGGRVYVHFGVYGTACLDTATGKKLWERRDFPCNHHRGPGSSPILYQDLLIVPFDGFDVQYVVALDKATGKTVWKKDRGIDWGDTDGDLKKAYATGRIVNVDGKPELIIPGAGATMAYDPRTGDELWRVRAGGMNAAIPVLERTGKLFLTTGDGGFRLYALRPDGKGDLTDSHVEWKTAKGVPSRCGPVLVGDRLYLVSEQGFASCIDTNTGKTLWQDRLKGEFSSSAVYADGRIYACTTEGTTYVMEPGDALKVLAANKLDAGCIASPAVAGKALFIRTKTHLYRIESK